MPEDQKISADPVVTSLLADDYFPLIRGTGVGANKRISGASLLAPALLKSNNLSDILDAPTARANLGIFGMVQSFHGRGGAVTMQSSDLNGLSGAGLVGISEGAVGTSSPGSLSIDADTNEDDIGVVALRTRNKTRLQVNNDGVIFLPRNDRTNLVMKFAAVDGNQDVNFGYIKTAFFGRYCRSFYWGINAKATDGEEVLGEGSTNFSFESNWQIDADATHLVDEAHLCHSWPDGVSHRPFTWYMTRWEKRVQLRQCADVFAFFNTLATSQWAEFTPDLSYLNSPMAFRGGDLLLIQEDATQIMHVLAPAGLDGQLILGPGDEAPAISEGHATYAPVHDAPAGSLHLNPSGGGGLSGATGSPAYVRDRLSGWLELNGTIRALGTFNVGSIAAGTTLDHDTLIAPPAGFGPQDKVDVRAAASSGDLDAGLIPWAFISTVGTIILRLSNVSAGAIDLPSRDWIFQMSH